MKRYEFISRPHDYKMEHWVCEMEESPDGEWVRWEDVKQTIHNYDNIVEMTLRNIDGYESMSRDQLIYKLSVIQQYFELLMKLPK